MIILPKKKISVLISLKYLIIVCNIPDLDYLVQILQNSKYPSQLFSLEKLRYELVIDLFFPTRVSRTKIFERLIFVGCQMTNLFSKSKSSEKTRASQIFSHYATCPSFLLSKHSKNITIETVPTKNFLTFIFIYFLV